MEIDGLPLHPLINDSAVALVPLSVLVVVAFALLPSWRWLSRWGALLTTLAGMGSLVVTWWTGRDYFNSQFAKLDPNLLVVERLHTHQARANVLMWVYIVFTVVVVLAFFLMPAPSRLADGRMAFRGNDARWVGLAMPAALVLVGVVCLVWVALTGHAGAQAVWGRGQ